MIVFILIRSDPHREERSDVTIQTLKIARKEKQDWIASLPLRGASQ